MLVGRAGYRDRMKGRRARGPVSLEKRVAAGTPQKVPLHKQEVFLSEVRGHTFNLKHVTLLLKAF